jgi:hypothetical protein
MSGPPSPNPSPAGNGGVFPSELYRITTKGNIGIGTAVPRWWLEFRGVGYIEKPPNRWRRFWAWALLGWRWERPA